MSNQIEPNWANYIAMDGDGLESFYEKKPILVNNRWRSDGKRMLVDGILNDSSRFKESLRFTDQAERKISSFISSIGIRESEEKLDRFYDLVLKPKVNAMLAAKNMELKDLTHNEIANIIAEYVLHEHNQTILVL